MEQTNQLTVVRSTQNLIAATAAKNSMEVAFALRSFKLETGAANFPALLSIPADNRIVALAKKDFKTICGAIVVGLTVCFESMNLKRPMTAIQIVDVAEIVIETAAEDNLAMEDLMLFLQKLVRGEYGTNYESMDIPKFMEKFEVYRQERFEELQKIRYAEHAQLSGLGNANRDTKSDDLDNHFSTMAGRLNEMKKELRKKNETIKQQNIDNF